MIIPAGYAQVNLIFTGVDLPTGAECTFGVDNIANNLTPQELAQEVYLQADTADLRDMWTVGVNLSSILVKVGPNATGPSHLEPGSLQGTATGQSVGPNTAWLVHKSTNFGGRAGRGRMYIPGCSESLVTTSGEANGTTATVFTNLLEAFRTGMATSDCVLHLLHGAGSPLTVPTEITGLACDQRVATQRRRNRR